MVRVLLFLLTVSPLMVEALNPGDVLGFSVVIGGEATHVGLYVGDGSGFSGTILATALKKGPPLGTVKTALHERRRNWEIS